MTDTSLPDRAGVRCAFCGTDILCPVRSEIRSTAETLHVWHCPTCTSVFETSELAPPEAEVQHAIEAYWPNLLVA